MLGRIIGFTLGSLLILAIVVIVQMALSHRAVPAIAAATPDYDQNAPTQKIMDMLNRVTNDVEALQTRAADVDKVLNRSSGVDIKNAAAIVEIESQFCMNDLVRNQSQMFNVTITKMLWEKAFPGSAFPTDNQYYPHICNEVAAAARAAAPDAPAR